MPGSSRHEEETMKALSKGVREEKKDTNRYLACPRCGVIVPYHRRYGHHCFRKHLMEIEMDIARMGRAMRI
jgi:uncharacterized C2H2 Zn-finger protein